MAGTASGVTKRVPIVVVAVKPDAADVASLQAIATNSGGAVVHEFPAGWFRGVGDRLERPECPQYPVEARQRKAPCQEEVAALRQRLPTGIRRDVRVRQRGAVDIVRDRKREDPRERCHDGGETEQKIARLGHVWRLEVTQPSQPRFHRCYVGARLRGGGDGSGPPR